MSPSEKFLWDMKVTAGARFNASHRLLSKERFANLSLSLFSAVLLSISIIMLAFELSADVSRALSAGSIVASVLALVFSMKIYAERYAVEAEQMHRCSLEINEIRRMCSTVDLTNSKNLSKFTLEYNSVLQKYSINHSDRDYLKYKYEHRWEFNDLRNEPLVFERFSNVVRFSLENLFERAGVVIGFAGLAAALASLLSELTL